jgi:SagB-type dehydrogenase family enzyme
MNKWIFSIALPVLLAATTGGLGDPSGHRTGADEKARPTIVPLPDPDLKGMTVEEAIKIRRSQRGYMETPIGLKELSQLLFAAQGITGREASVPLRAAPSAGALYPIELYVVVNHPGQLQRGLYHYEPELHALRLLRGEDLRARLSQACLGQEFVGQASVALIMTAIYSRTTGRYGQRGQRYVHMEAGHISQNIYLQATSLGLGSVAVGAFHDDQLNELLGADGEKETALYVHPVGQATGSPGR